MRKGNEKMKNNKRLNAINNKSEETYTQRFIEIMRAYGIILKCFIINILS